ncbi:MAG: hypothetical protein M1817_002885 [Caeruleum heppii]|nr:MAG: hypothetical protein M1817_002885 [Caeruleum heppii]
MLLALELMPRSLSASVSFLEEAAARAFLAHARRQPLSIRSNKVDVRWNERQPRISGHILDKARKGATRNIMLHNVTKEVTEQQIRQDLEHIDGLVIVDVSFRFRNVYVALNSIMASFFARICMESRSLYKTTGPVYCADECAQPLPLVPQGLSKDQGTLSVQRSTPSTNRFYILSQESADDGSQNLGTDQDSVDISAPTSSLSWADDTSNL